MDERIKTPILILFFLIMAFYYDAKALGGWLETTLSDQTNSAGITLYGDFNKLKPNEQSNLYQWGFSYLGKSVNSNTITHDLSFDLDLVTAGNWKYGVKEYYALIPSQSLTSMGPGVLFGYTFTFANQDAIGADDDDVFYGLASFSPSLSFLLEFDNITFSQGTKVKMGRGGGSFTASNNSTDIDQYASRLNLIARPWYWFKAEAIYSKFIYNKNVWDFNQNVLMNNLQRQNSMGINSSLSDLYDNTFGLDTEFYFFDRWIFGLSHWEGRVALDSSLTKTETIRIALEPWKNWELGLRNQLTTYSNSLSNPTRSSLFDINYYF